ncbi:hypothetical protein [Virgibacillus dakarensis]|uniref:hypothetical protein n=1 Tax=Virgibacillus dakarensis TaxID=1917889 RepID=UPI000B43DCAD|nr:hypothetical protein [Virgibacillus dakarensis]
MEREEWMLNELKRMYDNSEDYNQRALLLATKKLIMEQAKRIYQMEGELEGTLWSPRKWGD